MGIERKKQEARLLWKGTGRLNALNKAADAMNQGIEPGFHTNFTDIFHQSVIRQVIQLFNLVRKHAIIGRK
jgi:hypothetical protein